MYALRAGLSLGLSLIIALGPQNMFIIRQGFKREYVFLTALVCVLCDALMMLTSTSSLSHMIAELPIVKMILLILGVGFLSFYGGNSLYSGIKVLRSQVPLDLQLSQARRTMIGTIIAAMSFSLLNPHAVIECVIMIGGIAIQYPTEDQYWFVAGAILASIIWFYAIAYTAAWCYRFVNNQRLWAGLEITSGIIMLLVAVRFLLTF